MGSASKDIAIGVTALDPNVFPVTLGFDALSILKPKLLILKSHKSMVGLALSVSTPLVAYLIWALLNTQLASTLVLLNFTPTQSFLAGEVAPASPLLSPPQLSSFKEVK